MPLSEHEQRMLDEIENALYAEDPAFATTVRRTASARRRPSVGVIGLAVTGLVLLVAGFFYLKPGGFPVLSFLGFLFMFGAGVVAMRSSSRPGPGAGTAGTSARRGRGPASGPRTGRGSNRARGAAAGSYTERMEERFRRRFEG